MFILTANRQKRTTTDQVYISSDIRLCSRCTATSGLLPVYVQFDPVSTSATELIYFPVQFVH